MAPRRGGGSSGGGSSGSSGSVSGGSLSACPGAFHSGLQSTSVVYFANYCLFFVLTLAVLISLCCIRKRHGKAKRLLGPVYILSLLFLLIGYALLIIATTLSECRILGPYTFYDFAIAYMIFFRLSTYLLLVVVIWEINSLSREHIGFSQGIFKAVCIAILGIMGVLTCGYVGLTSWNNWTFTRARRVANDADYKGFEQERLAMAYYVLYLLSVVAGAALSGITLLSRRSRQLPVGNLAGWIITLTLTMFVWLVLTLVTLGYGLREEDLSFETEAVIEYLENFFQTFSFVAVLFLAKSHEWGGNSVGHSTAPQQPIQPVYPIPQQQAYNGNQGQPHYYQQQPVYDSTSPQLHNGIWAQVK